MRQRKASSMASQSLSVTPGKMVTKKTRKTSTDVDVDCQNKVSAIDGRLLETNQGSAGRFGTEVWRSDTDVYQAHPLSGRWSERCRGTTTSCPASGKNVISRMERMTSTALMAGIAPTTRSKMTTSSSRAFFFPVEPVPASRPRVSRWGTLLRQAVRELR